MKPFLLLTAFFFTAILAKAQHNHFIYLQADNKQPFYVKVKEKLYSSSSSGYLIIPKLQAGTHNLSIGFPKNQWPEQTIPVTISGKDLGYLLKNFDGKGWGLFNIQTMDVIMSSTASAAPAARPETKTDEFSTTLADVVNTPSIKEIKKEEPGEEKKPEPVKKEEPVAVVPVVQPIEVPKAPEKAAEVAKENPAKPQQVIKKIRSTQTGEAANITYLISDEFGSDTVEIMIPVEKTEEPAANTTVKEIKPAEMAKVKEVPAPKEEGAPKFIEIELPNPHKATEEKESGEPKKAEDPKTVATPSKPEENNIETPKAAPLQMINSDCKTVASEDDFIKARKKMTAQKSDDDMVNAAKKLFKQKCYSTAQVKNLSVLFLKDEGKYKFFDAVYPFVYDSREFKQLESQLTEEYYISRFRSMIRN